MLLLLDSMVDDFVVLNMANTLRKKVSLLLVFGYKEGQFFSYQISNAGLQTGPADLTAVSCVHLHVAPSVPADFS